ncbi:MAG: AEC family transporter [candidate division WOR-3 bacterium]
MFNTSLKIAFIVLLAFIFRFLKVFNEGDEKILNAYVYYVALPAFLLLELNRLILDKVTFKISGVIFLSILAILLLFLIFQLIFGFEKRWFNILSLSTVFGSTAFFGIPFVSFAYSDSTSLQLTALVASVSGVIGLTIVLLILEIERSGKISFLKLIVTLSKRFARNPLFISIILGIFLNVAGIKIGGWIYEGLDMVAKSTAVVAIFMLGLFLYGRSYRLIWKGILLALPRVALLPLITFLIAKQIGISGNVLEILVILQAMPVAITMISITQKYDFEKELFSNIVMVSSISSLFYLNAIRFVLTIISH